MRRLLRRLLCILGYHDFGPTKAPDLYLGAINEWPCSRCRAVEYWEVFEFQPDGATTKGHAKARRIQL